MVLSRRRRHSAQARDSVLAFRGQHEAIVALKIKHQRKAESSAGGGGGDWNEQGEGVIHGNISTPPGENRRENNNSPEP